MCTLFDRYEHNSENGRSVVQTQLPAGFPEEIVNVNGAQLIKYL